MRPKERRKGGEQDLFRARLDQIIDLDHALVRLARAIDWRFLEEKLGAVYTDATRTAAMKPSDLASCRGRHDGAAEGGDVPDRRQAFQPGARAAGATGQQAWRGAASIGGSASWR